MTCLVVSFRKCVKLLFAKACVAPPYFNVSKCLAAKKIEKNEQSPFCVIGGFLWAARI